MSDLAAHLVEEVLPEEPIRQWVCSLPCSLRYALAYDRALCADVLDAFIGALTRSLRWRAKRELGLRSVEDARVGAITFVQRSDGSLRVNPHFHTLALDGVYVRGEDGVLAFHALSLPTGEEIAQVSAWAHEAIVRILERHGRSLEARATRPTRWRMNSRCSPRATGPRRPTCSCSVRRRDRRPASSCIPCVSCLRPPRSAVLAPVVSAAAETSRAAVPAPVIEAFTACSERCAVEREHGSAGLQARSRSPERRRSRGLSTSCDEPWRATHDATKSRR